MKFSNIAIWLLAAVFAAGSPKAEGSELLVPKLESLYIVDACGEPNSLSKEVFITLSIGDVKKSDSLYGFDFGIKYDPAKIKIESAIWQNTISQFFETKSFSTDASDSTIYGTAGNWNLNLAPAEGTGLALVAFYGHWLGDCPDSSAVSITYLKYFEEFKKENSHFEPTKVYSIIKDKPDRILNYSFDTDKVSFDSDSIIDVIMSIAPGNSNLSKITFDLVITNVEFDISEIELLDQNSVIENQIKIENGYRLEVALNQPSLVQLLKISIKNKGTIGEYVGNMALQHVRVNDCDCIVNFNEDETELYSKIVEDDTTSVVDNRETTTAVYDNISNMIIIKTEASIAKQINIYDINGKLVYQISDENEMIYLDATALDNGVYAVEIDNKAIKKIINLIKY